MADRPNILVFMTDQQQGLTTDPGYPCLTPVADRFASAGMHFNRAHTVTALCAPARASLVTSLYPFRHGMWNNPHVPQSIRRAPYPGLPMFSHRLKEAGYRLYHTGNWHVEHEGKGPGAFGWETDDAATSARIWGTYPGSDKEIRTDAHMLKRAGYPDYLLYGTVHAGVEAFSEYRRAVHGAGMVKKLAQGAGPWCLYVGTHGPHDPYIAPEKYARMYEPKKVPLPASYGDEMEDKPGIYRRLRREVWGSVTPENAREAIAHYWAYCTMLDYCFGEVLAALEATGQAENTLAVFTSDHGDMMGAHGLFFKGIPAFEECYRIPMLARWPVGLKPGGACDEFTTLMDLGPTFIELAGGRPLEDVNGRSLVPLMQGRVPPDWPGEFYGMFLGTELLYSQRILTGRKWKYVFNGFDFDELYDLEADPGETRNLYHFPEHRRTLEEMVALMWKRAKAEKDEPALPDYPTVALPPIGPGGPS